VVPGPISTLSGMNPHSQTYHAPMTLDPRAQSLVDKLLRERGAVEISSDADDNSADTLESMRSAGIDTSQPLPVSFQLVFSNAPAVRQAGAELLVAGYPGIRLGDGENPNLHVLMQIVLTADALGQIRSNLESFASARGAWVAQEEEGGDQVIGRDQWRGRIDQQLSSQELSAVDQNVVDTAVAYDLDEHAAARVTLGIAFGDERTARRAGADLFAAGWPEIHIARAESAWVVEVALAMVPAKEKIRQLRENLSGFAGARAGVVAGINVEFAAPKQVQEES
jgi:regulator of ribonuclease activity B